MSGVPDLPPVPPPEFQVPNSLVEDPKWQRRFTYVWLAFAGAAILYNLSHLIKSIRSGDTWTCIGGVWERWGEEGYERVGDGHAEEKRREVENAPRREAYIEGNSGLGKLGKLHGVIATLKSFAMWSPPHVGLSVGQIFVVVMYYVVLIILTTHNATLMDNPDRAGYIALAQLPLVFILAAKNSPLSLLLGLGHGWEKLNYLHRWSGRGLFLATGVHGALWIRNHVLYGLPILGQQKETSGVACFGILGVMVLLSLKPVRALGYQIFFISHVLGFVSFFITLRYHTIYAAPWIYPPLAFYGFDLLLRVFRFRIKDATLIPCDEQMTIVSIDDCDGGWRGGQHVRLRLFFDSRVLEAHPVTVMCAPPDVSCIRGVNAGRMVFGVRACGDWSKAVNRWAWTAAGVTTDDGTVDEVSIDGEKQKVNKVTNPASTSAQIIDKSQPMWINHPPPHLRARVHAMLDGPYGGCSVRVEEYESVLFVSGGSGITFVMGVLDGLVGRCLGRGKNIGEVRTRRVEVVWCVRSFGAIRWFSPFLADIALAAQRTEPPLDLHFSIYVTCLCDPEAVPSIPNCDVLIERPTCTQIVKDLLAQRVYGNGVGGCKGGVELESMERQISRGSGSEGEGVSTMEHEPALTKNSETIATCGGGLAVCAAGPESLVREAKNAVARVSLASGLKLGRVGMHSEVYAL